MPEVLDRLALELLDDARADRLGERRRPRRSPSASRERRAVGRVLVERRERHGARACAAESDLEQMRAAIDGVDRLPIARLARIGSSDRAVRASKTLEDRSEFARRSATARLGYLVMTR